MVLAVLAIGVGVAFAGEAGGAEEASQPGWAEHLGIQFTPPPAASAPSATAEPSAAPRSFAITPDVEKVTNPEECVAGHRFCGPGTPPLTYKGGEVQHNPALHVIFWGTGWFASSGPEVTARSLVEHLLSALSGSEYQGILTQYDDHTGHVSSTLAPAEYYFDGRPATSVSKSAIINEAEKAISTKKWTTGVNQQFIVLVAGTFEKGFDPEEGGRPKFCSYHSVLEATGIVKEQTSYTAVPYQGDIPHCGGKEPVEEAPYFTSGVVSHEYAESVTDPYQPEFPGPNHTGHAWTESGPETEQPPEVADLCQEYKKFDKALEANINALWDNHLEGCAIADASPPPDAIPPLATSHAASSVTCTTAKLNGTVEPSNAETEYYFEYGDGEGAKKIAPAPNGKAASSWATDPEGYELTSLTPNKEYKYQLFAINANGTVKGGEDVFETKCGAPVAATGAATGETTTGVVLHAGVNPNGAETSYSFEYGKEKGKLEKHAGTNIGASDGLVEESKAITGLTPATTYYFRVVASNTDGTSEGAEESFTTHASGWSEPPYGRTEPATSVEETTTPETTAVVGGLVGPKDLGTNYRFEWGETTAYGSKTPERSAGEGNADVPVSETLSGLKPLHEYHYRIRAASAGGVTLGADEGFTTPGWASETGPEAASELSGWVGHAASCTEAHFCLLANIEHSTTEYWNGSTWKSVSDKMTGWSEDMILGVSCWQTNDCMGVGTGTYGGSGYMFAATWNGSGWSEQHRFTEYGESESRTLNGVACRSAYSCTAVGSVTPSGKGAVQEELIVRWNGSTWSRQPGAPAEDGQYLHNVSCAELNMCVATGYLDQSGKNYWTIETSNGGAWKLAVKTTSYLDGVSCLAGGECTVVGTGGIYRTFSPGSTFTFEAQSGMTIYGVSCTSATFCEAVGGTSTVSTEDWNGKTWREQKSPVSQTFAQFVDCWAERECIALGREPEKVVFMMRYKPPTIIG